MILEEIYNGQIYPAENVVPRSERYRKASSEISRIMTCFEEKLNKEDYALLETLCDSYADETSETGEEHFKYGFAMGVLLMCEIFHSPFFPKAE